MKQEHVLLIHVLSYSCHNQELIKLSSRVLRSQPLSHWSILPSLRRCLRTTWILSSLICDLDLWITTRGNESGGFVLFVSSLGCCSKILSWHKFVFARYANEPGLLRSHWDIGNLAEPVCKIWCQRFPWKKCDTMCTRQNTVTNPTRLWHRTRSVYEFRHVCVLFINKNLYEEDRIWVSLRNSLQAKYTITCFSRNGQRMRTNIVAIGTRPSFLLNFNWRPGDEATTQMIAGPAAISVAIVGLIVLAIVTTILIKRKKRYT